VHVSDDSGLLCLCNSFPLRLRDVEPATISMCNLKSLWMTFEVVLATTGEFGWARKLDYSWRGSRWCWRVTLTLRFAGRVYMNFGDIATEFRWLRQMVNIGNSFVSVEWTDSVDTVVQDINCDWEGQLGCENDGDMMTSHLDLMSAYGTSAHFPGQNRTTGSWSGTQMT